MAFSVHLWRRNERRDRHAEGVHHRNMKAGWPHGQKAAAWLLPLLALCVACGTTAAPPVTEPAAGRGDAAEAQAWPGADALFRSDPRWLGGDSAYSVPLGPDRTLWLFGDSFVSVQPPHRRDRATLVRNTVAIQEGSDPSRATLAFHWRTDGNGDPASFVPDRDDEWRWPLHGIRGPGGLTLFLLREVPAPREPLGFETVGWDAVRVTDPDAPPDAWTLERLETFDSPFPVAVGASVIAVGDFIMAYAVREPGDHDVYLARWSVEDFAAGRLATAEWWDGDGRWEPQAGRSVPPRPVFERGATELSVTFVPALGRYVAVHSSGYGRCTIVVRTAPAPEGPWTPPTPVYRPPESDLPGAVVYAAKGHPSLRGGDLVLTYATNTRDPEAVVATPELYYPRFVRMRLAGTAMPRR
jgi:hypothetical protein